MQVLDVKRKILMLEPFRIIHAKRGPVPILLSVPHCGTLFPGELQGDYIPEMMAAPDDTDWFVDRLYGFAPEMGIAIIHAVYSRWVIDLNRHPESKPLYTDGRIITGLCPTTDFFGKAIYGDHREAVSGEETQRRVQTYYNPYHEQVVELLKELRSQFDEVLLWDCHSIRHLVPTIRKEKFPDLILGDADGASASPGLSELALHSLEQSGLEVTHNHPFKGGYITRAYGKPVEGIHALQLEMSKINYMDDTETHYDESRADTIRVHLKSTLQILADQLLEADHHP